jgi:hypothetical protein
MSVQARSRSIILGIFALFALACSPGDRGIGSACDAHSDCDPDLQCLDHTCVPRCLRTPDCGDGYSCDPTGACSSSSAQAGDLCASEGACAAGLACILDEEDTDGDRELAATCGPDQDAHPFAAPCALDADCRNFTCALGMCVDLCSVDLDCARDHACSRIPRVEAPGRPSFRACIPSHGTLSWDIPVAGPSAEVPLPIPDRARSALVSMSVSDLGQLVGSTAVISPGGAVLFRRSEVDYFSYPIRHRAQIGNSALAFPPSPDHPIEGGTYRLGVSSIRQNGLPGSATPRVKVTAKLDDGRLLDLHFYFLNLDDHPCSPAVGGLLDASTAQTSPLFQDDYLVQLRSLFAMAGVTVGKVTYTDLRNHADLDGVRLSTARELLSLSTLDPGISVFFARSITPAGILAFAGGTPGDSSAGSPIGGLVLSLDTLCFRTPDHLARLTVHAAARSMGLSHNITLDGNLDPIADSDGERDNLMHFSEFGGTRTSMGQRAILTTSVVLR